jgi:mono/diheme cytochrome c family protein
MSIRLLASGMTASATALLLFVSIGEAQQGTAATAKPSKHNALIYSELDKAPERERLRPNPLVNDPEAPLAGKKLFQRHCAACHGESAEGGRHAPSLRAAEVQQAPAGAIFWVLTNGIVWRGMPVWSKLPEPQRWQLVTYIKSLGVKRLDSAGGVAPTRPQPQAFASPTSPRR